MRGSCEVDVNPRCLNRMADRESDSIVPTVHTHDTIYRPAEQERKAENPEWYHHQPQAFGLGGWNLRSAHGDDAV